MGRETVKFDFGVILIAIAIAWVILPPDMDPMILLKERLEGWPKRSDRRWDPDRGWDRRYWWVFVISVAGVIILFCTATWFLAGPQP
jgi:hypothetical protein